VGGQEDSFPSTREWADELEALFGERVREEILAEAAPFLPAAVFEMDPESVRPSVDLLETILPLAGSMSESQLSKLRPRIDRCVQELTKMLANQMRPALFGASSVLPTRRPNNRLDIRRTIQKNMARVYVNEEGKKELYPDRLIFKSAQKKIDGLGFVFSCRCVWIDGTIGHLFCNRIGDIDWGPLGESEVSSLQY